MLKRLISLPICFLTFSFYVNAAPVLLKAEQNIKEYSLDNGMRIILAPNNKEDKVYMTTIYLTGSLNDPEGKGGLSHLLEHLSFKGTSQEPGASFRQKLDQYTIYSNASTTYRDTKYINTLRADPKSINEVLKLEAQRMQTVVFSDDLVRSELKVVEREREIRYDDPDFLLQEKLNQAGYGNKYFGRSVIGDLNELSSIKAKDLEQYYKTWYAPNNAVMVVTGKFDSTPLLKDIEASFAAIPKKTLAKSVDAPALDISKLKNKIFSVAKGNEYKQISFYIHSYDRNRQAALNFAPYLYTLYPSGLLYKSLVESGKAINVSSTQISDPKNDIVYVNAQYGANQDPKAIIQVLKTDIPKNADQFNLTQLNRIKAIYKNQLDVVLKSSSILSNVLSDYVVNFNDDWPYFFKLEKEIQAIDLTTLNKQLKGFFIDSHRISAELTPTPESQRNEVSSIGAISQATDTVDQIPAKPEPEKDISFYQDKAKKSQALSQRMVEQLKKKIDFGRLSNGMQYGLFNTTTRDDKVYATIKLGFGNVKSLSDKAVVIALVSPLLLKGSEKYNEQALQDKAYAANASINIDSVSNHFVINIAAQKDHFEDYLKFIIEILKEPKFAQKDFDLISSQLKAYFDRPYTEPDVVASLTQSRELEVYQPNDLRYHFEPGEISKYLDKVTNDEVKALYKNFFAMNYGQIAVTGEFNQDHIKTILQNSFANWNSSENYQRLNVDYVKYTAKNTHVLAEKRQFGAYLAYLAVPVQDNNPDAVALVLLDRILGGSQVSSRLAQALREQKGLVYGFRSSMMLDAFVPNGSFRISANYSAGKSAQISAIVHQVLQDLIKNGVTNQELEKAKAEILEQRSLSLTDERSVHGKVSVLLERNANLSDIVGRDKSFAALSVDDIKRVIKKYIHLDQLVEVSADSYKAKK